MRESVPESICREGYGPGGAAVILTCRPGGDVAADRVRPIFAALGGRLGAANSVGYLFRPVGLLRYARSNELEARAVAAGAEDVWPLGGDALEVQTDPDELDDILARLRRFGHAPQAASIEWRAAQRVRLSAGERSRLEELQRLLGEVSGVSHVYTNAQITDEQRLAPV